MVDAPNSFVDAQQLWTLHGSCFRASNVPALDQPWLNRVDKFLSRYLAFAEGPRVSPLCQGRVIGLNLTPVATVEGRGAAAPAWRRSVEALVGLRADVPERWTLPAMIVSHDSFNDRTLSPAPLSLVTVVPLVRLLANAPKGQRALAPPRAPGERHTALSFILLTVDPRANAPDSRRRVSLDLPGYGEWIIGDSDRRDLLDDVRSAVGLPEGLP